MPLRRLLLLSLLGLSGCLTGPIDGAGGGPATGGGEAAAGGGSAAGGGAAVDAGLDAGVGPDAGSCGAGYAFDGAGCVDVDECQVGPVSCSEDATCVNTPGGYRCDCGPGHVDDGTACVDVDECATHTAECDSVAICTNTDGAYTCACPAGYDGDGQSCSEIDECAAGTAGCAPAAICTNLPGSFSCACRPGYAGNGITCTELDECANGTAICSPNTTCVNTPGSYRCVCAPGYAGDGVLCTDVDECAATPAPCGADGTCTNSLGSFSCSCAPGYAFTPGVGCVDVNECLTGTVVCAANAGCVNTPGSFACACLPGFFGDGVSCTDVDECGTGAAGCSANATCANSPGSFSCTCKAGYTGDGKTCLDVDECQAGTATCSSNATCANSPGSYSCTCKPGFVGNGTVCGDVDECLAGTATCSTHATCANTVGSYACTCASGYTGDGHTCTCTPESDPALCAAHPTACGTQALVDHCGTSRIVTCGSCGVTGASISVHLTMGVPDTTVFPGVVNTTKYGLIRWDAGHTKHEYVLSYNSTYKVANWTSWQLDSRWRGPQGRSDTFRADDALPLALQPGPQPADYSEPIYDRGHMCPSADRNLNAADNTTTFYLTNMVPQATHNNQGPWQKLEAELQAQADLGREIYIVSGPHWVPPIGLTLGTSGVSIPTNTFKVAVVLNTVGDGVAQVTTSTRVIGVLMPNDNAFIGIGDPWTKWCAKPRKIEQLTGLNFNADVPQAIQDAIETKCDPACDTSSASYLANCN